jgi:polyhydroxyalkanoate synthesis regulator phasin
MFELLKKSILAGLGTAVVTKSKVQETMQKMVEQGKITSEEAEKFTREIVETGESEFKEIREEVSKAINKTLSELNLADREEVDKLQSRLQELEKRMDMVESKGSGGSASKKSG